MRRGLSGDGITVETVLRYQKQLNLKHFERIKKLSRRNAIYNNHDISLEMTKFMFLRE